MSERFVSEVSAKIALYKYSSFPFLSFPFLSLLLDNSGVVMIVCTLYCVAQSYAHWREQFLSQMSCIMFRFRMCFVFSLGPVYLCQGYYLCLPISSFLFLVVSTSAIDCLERLVSEMTYYLSSGTLNSTHLGWNKTDIKPLDKPILRFSVYNLCVNLPVSFCFVTVNLISEQLWTASTFSLNYLLFRGYEFIAWVPLSSIVLAISHRLHIYTTPVFQVELEKDGWD